MSRRLSTLRPSRATTRSPTKVRFFGVATCARVRDGRGEQQHDEAEEAQSSSQDVIP
jgi:hypothetical protein